MAKKTTPKKYDDAEKQKWFESLEKVNRDSIPRHLVPKTNLKRLGIKVNEEEAVAWAYQQFYHLPYLLYDVRKYT